MLFYQKQLKEIDLFSSIARVFINNRLIFALNQNSFFKKSVLSKIEDRNNLIFDKVLTILLKKGLF